MKLSTPRSHSLGIMLIAACSFVVPMASAQEVRSVNLSDRTEIDFASIDQGKELIGKVDGYISRTEELERQMRLQTNEPVSVERFTQALQATVKDWKAEEIESIATIVDELKKDLKAYDLPLPERIHLIRIGSFAGANNMPHCREASIVLPDGFFNGRMPQKKVFVHELFHVLSSHNPKLRDKLYSIIGFQPCNEIDLPKSLAERRLTNPDAPSNFHRIELENQDGNSFSAVPIITLNVDRYTSGIFMQHMKFNLMVVEEDSPGHWRAKVKDGAPELLSPRQVPDFMKRIGRNTQYIIHPEETLADNFAILVLGKKNAPDPWVIDQMREVLSDT